MEYLEKAQAAILKRFNVKIGRIIRGFKDTF